MTFVYVFLLLVFLYEYFIGNFVNAVHFISKLRFKSFAVFGSSHLYFYSFWVYVNMYTKMRFEQNSTKGHVRKKKTLQKS